MVGSFMFGFVGGPGGYGGLWTANLNKHVCSARKEQVFYELGGTSMQ